MDKIQKINRDYYNKNALQWAAIKNNPFFHEKSFRKFVKYFKTDDRILDIGCAHGIDVPLFLGIGRKLKYEGVDISSQMISLAKARYPQLRFRVCDILDKRCLSKRKYNGLWAAAVLQHIPEKDWLKALNNMEASLQNGGICYITVPNNRPNPSSAKDKRHFTLFDDGKFQEFIKPIQWKIIHSGKYKNTNPTSGKQYWWLWYIVRIPVKHISAVN